MVGKGRGVGVWVAVVGAAVETNMTGDTIPCANNYNLYGVFMLILR